MKSTRSDSLIAFGVLICSGVLLVALTMALSGWQPNRAKRTLQVDYPDVTGIKVHSGVRYAGAPAGEVIHLRLLSDEERIAAGNAAVRVTIRIFDTVPQFPDDIRAAVASDTLLSDKFIALSAGSPGRPKLPNGAILRGTTGGGLDGLIEGVGPLVRSVESLVAQVGKTLEGFDSVVVRTGSTVDTFHTGIAEVLPRISKLADSLNTTSDTATAAVKRIDKMVDDIDPVIQEDLKKLGTALGDLQKTLDAAGRLMSGTDKQVVGRMQELSVVLQNLKVATTNAKAFTKAIGEKPSRLIFSGKAKDLPSEQEILRSNKPVPTR